MKLEKLFQVLIAGAVVLLMAGAGCGRHDGGDPGSSSGTGTNGSVEEMDGGMSADGGTVHCSGPCCDQH